MNFLGVGIVIWVSQSRLYVFVGWLLVSVDLAVSYGLELSSDLGARPSPVLSLRFRFLASLLKATCNGFFTLGA